MKTLILTVISLLALAACGLVTIHKQEPPRIPLLSDTSIVYKYMTDEICNCITNTMKNNKPSAVYDSCHEAIIDKFADTLKAMDFDPATTVGRVKLAMEIKMFDCGNIAKLMEIEMAEEEAKKLFFYCQFVSQKKLATDEYEVILRDNKTKKLMHFKSEKLFDKDIAKKIPPGQELAVEYKIAKNAKTQKTELYIIGGKFSPITADSK